MSDETKTEGLLSPYRVLDLTDEKGMLCGKLMGDLGADVIKVERPGGDPARNIGPFYHDEPDPEKSLSWFFYNLNKRSITLNIETADGKELFTKLVKTADFVTESFQPGYLDKIGLGYKDLAKVNPKIILVSITPYGQKGPYKNYKADDMNIWGMGGMMYMTGDPDHPPVRISHVNHAYDHGAAEGFNGAMAALFYRNLNGEGQQVDISIEEAVAQTVSFYTWDTDKFIGRRRGKGFDFNPPADGGQSAQTGSAQRAWMAKDGAVSFYLWSGELAKRYNTPVVQWLESEGFATDFLKNFDWTTYDLATAGQETIEKLNEPIRKFFATKTKAELFEGAAKRGIALTPKVSPADTLNNTQLKERGYWVEVKHPELGAKITYPGAFAKVPEKPINIYRRPPLIGEHNKEVYQKELKLTVEQMRTLKEAGVI